jgi:hypothetical protein
MHENAGLEPYLPTLSSKISRTDAYSLMSIVGGNALRVVLEPDFFHDALPLAAHCGAAFHPATRRVSEDFQRRCPARVGLELLSKIVHSNRRDGSPPQLPR